MKPTLLCLHGWGGSKESFTELREALKGTDIEILTPDLPGFGDEPEPSNPWTNDDYAEWVEEWLWAMSYGLRADSSQKPEAKSPKLYVLGHSHGGRVAMKLAIRGNLPINHLFLCAAAGIRHPQSIKQSVVKAVAKTGKAILSLPGLKQLEGTGKKMLYTILGVHDYERASPMMQQTMIHVTSEDFRPLLSYIKTPTDIFWGTEDTQTPITDAYTLKGALKQSTLHIYQGVRHSVHRDKAGAIASVIKERLKYYS